MKPYLETERGVLYQGDCLEVMKTLPDDSVDLTVTSPPYDNLRTYEGSLTDWTFEKFQGIAKELFRLTKAGGVVVWVVNDATINGSETGTSFRQALYFKDIGFNLHDTMIYLKYGSGMPHKSHRYGQAFEYMFVFSKGSPLHGVIETFDSTGMTRKTTRRMRDGTIKSGVYNVGGGKLPNVWQYKGECYDEHPAVFPITLAQDHIKSWSNEGELVLDCFMGSGTTAIACENLNRKWIGIEREEKYCEIIKNRLKNLQETLFK